MKDCLKVFKDELLQCKNNIVTHWNIKELNSVELKNSKFIGIPTAEILVGNEGKELTVMKCHGKEKVKDLQETFTQIVSKAENMAPFVFAGRLVWVNMSKLKKVVKTIEFRDKIYTLIFNDGQVMMLDEISNDLRQSLHARDLKRIKKKAENTEDFGENERQ